MKNQPNSPTVSKCEHPAKQNAKQSYVRTIKVAATLLVLMGAACQDPFLSVSPRTDPTLSPTSSSSTTSSSTASPSSLPHTNNTNLIIPVSVSAVLTTYDCSNNPGANITFEGAAATAGFGVRTIFRNNWDGTHTYTADASVDVDLEPFGQKITIPKQPVLGGSGGNPFIWVQFIDANGNAVSNEIFIGRCVQGYAFKFAQNVSASAVANTQYNVTGCSNSPGPNITFDANLSISGLSAKIIFRNNDNKVGGPHETDVISASSVTVIPDGLSFSFPKQPVLGGVGGNPWIWTQFMDGATPPAKLSDEILLGRCEQISKSL